MLPERIPKVALRWMPLGRWKRWRPSTTWRRTTADIELSEMGWAWGEAQSFAKDKRRWRRDIVSAYAPLGPSGLMMMMMMMMIMMFTSVTALNLLF